MFLKLDGTFIVQLLNFAIFFALLNVVFIRPVSKAIIKRREYINSVTNDYDRYQAEATALRTQAESIRTAARRDAEAALTKARSEASNESAALAAQYNEQVAKTVEEANRIVTAELESARASEPQLARELASLMVERTIGESAA
jgi:F0F1-type ATP synthase membrane subunit b/b'